MVLYIYFLLSQLFVLVLPPVRMAARAFLQTRAVVQQDFPLQTATVIKRVSSYIQCTYCNKLLLYLLIIIQILSSCEEYISVFVCSA